MSKLLKLSEMHYIGVDDSEIKESDLCYDPEGSPGYNNIKYVVKCLRTRPDSYWNKYCKKITHSTQPLYKNDFWAIKELKLSEVEEAIYGYSVEEMAIKSADINSRIASDHWDGVRMGYHLGFKAHQELVKDKLFTIEDMELLAAELIGRYRLGEIKEVEDVQKIINSRLPKTEWEVEIDEQGKIKLI